MLNHPQKTILLVCGALCLSLAQSTEAATPNPFVIKPIFKPLVSPASKLKPQKITSHKALANLLVKRRTNHFNRTLYDVMPTGGVSLLATDSGTTANVSHTETNIQVQGVDEADLVKVGDDGYIYQIYNNQVRIIKGFPISELNQEATLSFPDTNFYPSGLYIHNGKLVVTGSSWTTVAPEKTQSSKSVIAIDGDWYWYWNSVAQSRALIYDVTDHANPKQVRDVVIDGSYLDSRLIGDDLYLVTRSYPTFYMYATMADDKANVLAAKPSTLLPNISDTKAGKTTSKTLALKDISYFVDFVEPDYVVAASINLAHPEKSVTTKAYLGAGELVYVSTQSLYLSASKYSFDNTSTDGYWNYNQSTQIFKYAINKGQINFAAAGEVAGGVLNQFSMDEKDDYFRIATTTQNWTMAGNASKSSLFVLNKDMKTVGKIENLAQGEQIYSTRFLGDRCYIVTFRLIDPLFAIDLSGPTQPKVMGELKIPGYSNYLHPLDETHLIGFGKDAVVYPSEQENSDQFWADGSAFYQGLKVALFDVADMKNPKELYSVTIGDRGTQSPLLWNHKALYWDAERHLFGFPVELATLPQAFDAKQPWLYGSPTYQGAYIYEVTPEKGFTLKAKLSQLTEQQQPLHVVGDGYDYSYWGWESMGFFVDRLFRIDNKLYTLSNRQVSVYDLDNFQEQSSLQLSPLDNGGIHYNLTTMSNVAVSMGVIKSDASQ